MDIANASGGGWHANHTGPAHDAHIYQAQSGHSNEISVNQATRGTRFKTRMNCQTPAGTACAAGCTAKLYADVRYATRAFAEAHTWTIWNKAGTAQVVDGVTLKLRTPFGGPGETLFEKEVGASWAAKSTQFDVNQFVSLVRSGLGIYASIQSSNANPAIIGDLAADAIRALVGLVHREGSDGSTDQSLSVRYSTYFDYLTPITMSYSSTDQLFYGLDLTSLIKMRVRGYGYHSETGDLKSGYSIAVYMDNFVCDGSVTTPPQRTAFWRWDGYPNAPLPASTLQQQISNFFSVGIGVSVWPSANQGTVTQGVCGNSVCDTYETPATCSSDCGYCGNGICRSQFENAGNCVQDCGYCGDGTCYGSETNESCVNDCSVCGDGTCSGANGPATARWIAPPTAGMGSAAAASGARAHGTAGAAARSANDSALVPSPSVPAPSGGAPYRISIPAEDGIEERLRCLDDLIEGRPRELIFTGHCRIRRCPGGRRIRKYCGNSVGLAKREGLLERLLERLG